MTNPVDALFDCECKAMIAYPAPNERVTCEICGNVYEHQTQDRGNGMWHRIFKVRSDVPEPHVPRGWFPIRTAPANEFILLLCPAQTINLEYVVMVGRYTKGYHDRWDDEGGDALMDGGYEPIGWRMMSDFGLSKEKPKP